LSNAEGTSAAQGDGVKALRRGRGDGVKVGKLAGGRREALVKHSESTSLWVWSEGYAGVLPDPQSLAQMRVVKDIPEKMDHLAIAPKLIRKHKLDSSQHEREKRVIAMQQRLLYRRGPHEIT
jgi:hypothetical protein